jgi:hypothetical protein
VRLLDVHLVGHIIQVFTVFGNAILSLRRLHVRVLPYTIATQAVGIVLLPAA